MATCFRESCHFLPGSMLGLLTRDRGLVARGWLRYRRATFNIKKNMDYVCHGDKLN